MSRVEESEEYSVSTTFRGRTTHHVTLFRSLSTVTVSYPIRRLSSVTVKVPDPATVHLGPSVYQKEPRQGLQVCLIALVPLFLSLSPAGGGTTA